MPSFLSEKLSQQGELLLTWLPGQNGIVCKCNPAVAERDYSSWT